MPMSAAKFDPTRTSLSCSGARPSETFVTSEVSERPTNERLSPSRLTIVNDSLHDRSMGLTPSITRSTSSKSTSGESAAAVASLLHIPNVS